MNSYQPSPPRAAFVVAAIALTALTIGASVVAPVMLNPGVRETGALAEQEVVTPTSTPGVVSLGRIEVRACVPESPIAQIRNLQPKHNQPS
jgi:hypothetical protein